jgi:hypothetical protein
MNPIAGPNESAVAVLATTLMRDNCRETLRMGTNEPIVITLAELLKHGENYYGKAVTVDGDLHRSFAEHVFTIEDEAFLSDPDVLVIADVPRSEAVTAIEHSLEEGRKVRITGTVYPYNRGRLECAYGPLQLESHEGHSFTRNPVLIVNKALPSKVETPPLPLEEPSPVLTPPEPAAPDPAAPEPQPDPALPVPVKPGPFPKTAKMGTTGSCDQALIRCSRTA